MKERREDRKEGGKEGGRKGRREGKKKERMERKNIICWMKARVMPLIDIS